jgi:NAD(P)-dependent dehydrogenase (short-subunit alcohol dehydrogenase family)
MCRDALTSDGGRSVIAPRTDAVVIVTGGSSGTGREVVRMLARRGYAIVVVYLDDQRRAEATVEEIFASHGKAVAVRADVSDDLDVERLFDETIAAFGGVDAVVHTDEITPALARHVRGRDITVEDAGADRDVAELISFLDRGRHRPTR